MMAVQERMRVGCWDKLEPSCAEWVQGLGSGCTLSWGDGCRYEHKGEEHTCKRISMVAGGTGITPIWQVLPRVSRPGKCQRMGPVSKIQNGVSCTVCFGL